MGSIAGDLPQGTEDRLEQVEASCMALERLANYLPHWGMNKPAREVARSLRAYFEREFQRHCDEQEGYLFPALLCRASKDDLRDMYGTIARCMTEHRAIEDAWKEVRSVLADIALCRPRVLSTHLVTPFANLYWSHLSTEQDRLRRLLDDFGRDRILHQETLRPFHVQRLDRLSPTNESSPALRRFAAG